MLAPKNPIALRLRTERPCDLDNQIWVKSSSEIARNECHHKRSRAVLHSSTNIFHAFLIFMVHRLFCVPAFWQVCGFDNPGAWAVLRQCFCYGPWQGTSCLVGILVPSCLHFKKKQYPRLVSWFYCLHLNSSSVGKEMALTETRCNSFRLAEAMTSTCWDGVCGLSNLVA